MSFGSIKLDLFYNKSACSLMFWKRSTFSEVINNKKFGGTMKCHVCTNDVGEAPQCKLCKNRCMMATGNQLCVSLAPKRVRN